MIPAHSGSLGGATRTRRRTFRGGLLLGIGLMAAVDEIVFHQLLAWHHFYDRATLPVGLLSDGILHAAELVAIVAGGFLLVAASRQGALDRVRAWSGGFLGAGAFQLFDGLIDHKVLRLHQIRYGVPPWPYDLRWNAAGAALLLVGFLLWRRRSRV